MPGVTFDKSSAVRIATAVRRVERMPPPGRGGDAGFGGGGDRQPFFFAKVTGNAQDGTNKRWSYTYAEVRKNGAAYASGAWETFTGNRTGTLYNLIEYGNAATGQYRNGVSASNLIGTFALKPIPTDAIVLAFIVQRNDGTAEVWTQYENAIDGGC